MKLTRWLAVVLAVLGIVLALAPIVFALAATNWGALGTEFFNFDWFMPVELFPVTLLGLVLVLAASLLARSRKKLVGWSFGAIAGIFAGAAAWVQLSGLANGDREPGQADMIATAVLLTLYAAAVIAVCVGGALIVKDSIAARREIAPPGPSAG